MGDQFIESGEGVEIVKKGISEKGSGIPIFGESNNGPKVIKFWRMCRFAVYLISRPRTNGLN